jgi:hypothetical protein
VPNPWFRLYSEFANDPKVQSMPECMQRRLVMLFCLCCSDELVTLRDDEVAFALRISDTELAETKALFLRKKFIGDGWEIRNWDKRNPVSDSSTERTRAYRDRLRNKEVTASDGHVTALDKIRVEEKRKEESRREEKRVVTSQPSQLRDVKSSQRWEEWWTAWVTARGSNRRQFACMAWVSCVTVENEDAVFACTQSYLASLNGNGGYNPDKFLIEQQVDGYQARWKPYTNGKQRPKRDSVAEMIEHERIMAERRENETR